MINLNRKIYFVGAIGNPYSSALLGGQKVTIEHAQILRKYGVKTYVVTMMGRLETFFVSKKNADDLFISEKQFRQMINVETDVVVIPGRYLPTIDNFPGNNKVLFSQGAYITIGAFPVTPQAIEIWNNPSLKGVFCVSDGNAEIFKEIVKDIPVIVIPNHVENDYCTANNDFDFSQKSKSIVFPALERFEKNPLDTKVVLNLIASKIQSIASDIYKKLKFIELKGFSHKQIHEIFEEASLMLFLGNNEGMPLTVLESMCHGVITLGFNRAPLSEFLHSKCLFEIGQLNDMANTAASVLIDEERWSDVRRWVNLKSQEYDQNRHSQALLTAWEIIEDKINKH
ncbi:MAG: hypothetical protein GC149_17375 [Gammaproteobacteria bacterium]|nr:hypothetical protein [Gammaproteobacteria bacterium]